MSQDVKRKRLPVTNPEVETKKRVEIDFTEYANVPIEEFDWDAHQEGCPSQSRVQNTKLKTPSGWTVYSTAPYAQDFLNLLTGYEESVEHVQQLKIENGGIYDGVIETVNETWVSVDIGYRESVYVSVVKEEASIRDQFVVGNEVKIQVLEYGGSKGYVLGSISAGVKTAVVAEIMASILTPYGPFTCAVDKIKSEAGMADLTVGGTSRSSWWDRYCLRKVMLRPPPSVLLAV